MSKKTVIILMALGALFLYSKTGQAQVLPVGIIRACPLASPTLISAFA